MAARVEALVGLACALPALSGCADQLYGLGDQTYDDDVAWCAAQVEEGNGVQSDPVDCTRYCSGPQAPGWCSGCSTRLGQSACGSVCCDSGFVCESGQCSQVCANGRYLVLDPGTDGCHTDGSGLVKDTSTGLTWMRHIYHPNGGQTQAEAATYCTGKGMRLPTKDEALAIADTNYDSCAFPCDWYTWTSTPGGSGQAWHVGSDGSADEDPVDDGNDVLCVR